MVFILTLTLIFHLDLHILNPKLIQIITLIPFFDPGANPNSHLDAHRDAHLLIVTIDDGFLKIPLNNHVDADPVSCSRLFILSLSISLTLSLTAHVTKLCILTITNGV